MALSIDHSEKLALLVLKDRIDMAELGNNLTQRQVETLINREMVTMEADPNLDENLRKVGGDTDAGDPGQHDRLWENIRARRLR